MQKCLRKMRIGISPGESKSIVMSWSEMSK